MRRGNTEPDLPGPTPVLHVPRAVGEPLARLAGFLLPRRWEIGRIALYYVVVLQLVACVVTAEPAALRPNRVLPDPPSSIGASADLPPPPPAGWSAVRRGIGVLLAAPPEIGINPQQKSMLQQLLVRLPVRGEITNQSAHILDGVMAALSPRQRRLLVAHCRLEAAPVAGRRPR